MDIKLNVGAGPTWRKEGWMTLDHKIKEGITYGEAADIKAGDGVCATIFCSHMLEHIPHIQLPKVLSEFHRVLEDDGILRILVPDMRKLAKAYITEDAAFFDEVLKENETIRADLGFGGILATHFVGPGQDTALFNRQLTKFIAGYSHLYMYDFKMLQFLLCQAGFDDILQRSFCCSNLLDYEEPFHIEGLPPVWHNLNQEFYKKHNLVHRYDSETGKYDINFKTTGFDRNPVTALIIECRKSNKTPLPMAGHNYNHYSQSLLKDEKFRLKCKMIAAISKAIDGIE